MCESDLFFYLKHNTVPFLGFIDASVNYFK